MPTSENTQKGFSTGNGPLFYYITDRSQFAGFRLESCIRRVLKWGVDCIQIREKDLSDRALFDLVQKTVMLARGTGCRILVNGRADVALAAGAHGVHLPSTGLRIPQIRSWYPDGKLVGVSVHTGEEIRQACNDGADYLLLGHLFSTPSKTPYGNPLGLEYLREVCAGATVPVFALGGIVADRIDPVMKAGAAGVAGISLFQKEEEFSSLKKLHKRPRSYNSNTGFRASR